MTMAAPTMNALVASVRVGGAADVVFLFCVHCDALVADLDGGDLLTVGMDKVRKHAAVCVNWPELRRPVKAAAVVPGQISIQLPNGQ